MRVETTIRSMREACADLRRLGPGRRTLGLVPTMGALHAGHSSLVRACRDRCDLTAVSIFVNPTQFGPNEDLAKYPRTFAADCAELERLGVDLLFAPEVEEIYPEGSLGTYVEVLGVGDRLDGASRPGHFRGVATVVAKLLHIVTPEVAYFGQKDAAQVAVLRAMVRDLDLPVEMAVCPTVREPDGVAMSSRNRYLSLQERLEARALYAALRGVADRAAEGAADAPALRDKMRARLAASAGVRLDYAEIVDPETLLPVQDLSGGALVAVAAWVGSTRLIDNLVLAPPKGALGEGKP